VQQIQTPRMQCIKKMPHISCKNANTGNCTQSMFRLVNSMTSTHQLRHISSLYGHFMDREVVSGTLCNTYSDRNTIYLVSKKSFLHKSTLCNIPSYKKLIIPALSLQKRGKETATMCNTHTHYGVKHAMSLHTHLFFPTCTKLQVV
jgi:hypothetical protein